MSLDDYLRDLDTAFAIVRQQAESAADLHNESLPKRCPQCDSELWVPGLACGAGCGFRSDEPWLVVTSCEFGFELRPIGQRLAVATYHVDL